MNFASHHLLNLFNLFIPLPVIHLETAQGNFTSQYYMHCNLDAVCFLPAMGEGMI